MSISPAGMLVVLRIEGQVVLEEFETLVPVYFFHEAGEFVAPAENLVEFVVPKAYAVIVCYGYKHKIFV